MKRWAIACLAVCAFGASAVADVISEPLGQFAGHFAFDVASGQMVESTGPRTVGDIYDNVLAPAAPNTGVSSTTLTTVWGDQVTTTGTGTVKEFALTVFNSGSSAGPLLTMNVGVTVKRDADLSSLGGFSGNINFGAGLNPGFFSIVTFTNLDTLATPIVTDTTALRLEQVRNSQTGTASRLGIASLVPINVGSSPDTMLVNGAPTAFTVPANPGYRVNVIPEPASLVLIGLSALMAFRRR